MLLIVKGIAARTHGHERAQWIAFEPWTRSRRHLLAFAVTLGVNVFYILRRRLAGLHPDRHVYLARALRGLRRARCGGSSRWRWSPTLVIHTAFYKLLRVPLPWGVLQPILW